MPKKEIDDFVFEYVRETDKAICVTENGGPNAREFWLPKSQIEFEINGATVNVTMPIWLAREKSVAGY